MEKRIQTILAHAGVASRREAARLVEEGRVTVDGKVVYEKGYRVDPSKNKITVNGRPIEGEEKKYYFLFNKPKDVISTAKDTHSRKSVVDFFKRVDARLYPVGRLDRNTTGILIITNDGELTLKLSHPRFAIDKEYEVTVSSRVSSSDIRKMEKGIALEDEKTAPCKVKFLEENSSKEAIYRIILHEGKKRQVRRMFKFFGVKIRGLKRTKYAGLTLSGLARGKYRVLTEKEINRLKSL